MITGLNYIQAHYRTLTSYYADDTFSVWQTSTREMYKAEIRRIMTANFHEFGIISDNSGSLYIVNGANINTVEQDDINVLITFRNCDYLMIHAVTEQIAEQHKRYLEFVRDCNRLDELRQGRDVKIVTTNGSTGGNVYDSFEDLNDDLKEGDWVIIMPGTYAMTDAFTWKNGVDIEMKSPVINAQYSASTGIQHGLFTDHASPFAVVGSDEQRSDIADGTKRIKARIFGNATINVLDCPFDQFMPLIRNYYNSDVYAQAESMQYNNTNGSVMYSFQGAITARIKNIPQAQRLIDNDYKAEVCDLDTLTADISANTFFPGTDSVTEGLAIVRNAIITHDNGQAIDTIALSRFTYHYIHAEDTGSVVWLGDTFAAEGCNVYAHLLDIDTDMLTAGTHDSNFYNSGFENTASIADEFDSLTIYEDSLTIT